MTRELKWGYFGPRGTFTEQAARKLRDQLRDDQDVSISLIPYVTIPDVLKDVEKGTIDGGIVPIENSTEGSVNVTLDSLAHDANVFIVNELILPIRHHLLAKHGTEPEDISVVFSHPQALAQCRKNLDALVPNAGVLAATSTAEAAERVAGGTFGYAAIGTELAADIYDLTIVATDMQDFEDNATRFVRVGRDVSAASGHDKTSIMFGFASDKPGNLYRALKVFADHEVNLTKLESRPAKRSLGEYIFFVDMEGYVDDPAVSAALDQVRSHSHSFKLLGSYPRIDFSKTNSNSL